ncbi:calcium-dependent secretion activator 1 isoform X3 [Arapaima gigas]
MVDAVGVPQQEGRKRDPSLCPRNTSLNWKFSLKCTRSFTLATFQLRETVAIKQKTTGSSIPLPALVASCRFLRTQHPGQFPHTSSTPLPCPGQEVAINRALPSPSSPPSARTPPTPHGQWRRVRNPLLESNMLDPSSSEEESDGIVEEESKEAMAPQAGSARISPSRTSDSSGGLQPGGRGSGGRPSSPSPSAVSEQEKEDVEKMQREEEERKKKLQLYVFVMRCIAYPFNAKQPTDMARRQQKVACRVPYDKTDCVIKMEIDFSQ